ncbi:hypothetical protein THAOC_33103 [Thalassiosira oceanica]|uniref:Uncharacterized protein n=1 Tax=Thalassiosira oceanica TaxID=159749 RepID=K0R4P7_THAOC|nr:hypothetical protein THAOC_33103 [Thalassiosira oceanica]|eukprot:EJK48128.1 hypothetical protein THAOC_33103 [Thalassiosira oceanica]
MPGCEQKRQRKGDNDDKDEGAEGGVTSMVMADPADQEVPDVSSLILRIDQLQRDQCLMEQMMRNQQASMSAMQSDIEALKGENAELKRSNVDLMNWCSSLEGSIRVLKKSDQWEYSAYFDSDYWSERYDQGYCAQVRKLMTDMESKIVELRKYPDSGVHETVIGKVHSGHIVHDEALDRHFGELADAIQVLSLGTSLSLTIANIQLTPKILRTIEHAATKMDKIWELALISNSFTDSPSCCKVVAKMIASRSVCGFVLENNSINEDSARVIGRAVVENGWLPKIRIRNCCSSRDRAGYELMKCVLLLNAQDTRDSVDFEQNNITTQGGSAISEFLLSDDVDILELKLENNGLNDEDAIAMGIALRQSSIEELTMFLGGNPIGEIGWNALYNACYGPSSIATVVQSNHTCVLFNSINRRLFTRLYGNHIGRTPEDRMSIKLYVLFENRHAAKSNSRHLNAEFGGDVIGLSPFVLRFINHHVHNGHKLLTRDRSSRPLAKASPLSMLHEILRNWKMPELFKNADQL